MSLRCLLQVLNGFEFVDLKRGRHSARSSIAAFLLGCGALLAGWGAQAACTLPNSGYYMAQLPGMGTAIYGNNVTGYAAESNLNVALVHAGLLQQGQYAYVTVTATAGNSDYTATTANGITSMSMSRINSSSSCGMTLSVGTPTPAPAPTINIGYTPDVPVVVTSGSPVSVSWDSQNATAVSYACSSAPPGYIGSTPPGFNGSATVPWTGADFIAVTDDTWVRYPTTCVWTATGPGGTKTAAMTIIVRAKNDDGSCKSVTPASGVYTATPAGGDSVVGNNISGYLYNSVMSDALIHSGLLRPLESAYITVLPLYKVTGFTGTSANGITSQSSPSALCGMQLRLGGPVTPAPDVTLSVQGPPNVVLANNSYTWSWTTTGATYRNMNCVDSNGQGIYQSGSGNNLLSSGSMTMMPLDSWVGRPFTCTFTATGPKGTQTYNHSITTYGKPTIRVIRTPSPMGANQDYGVAWSTTYATSVSYSCTSGASGTVGPAGTLSGTAGAAGTGNCIWTATGPGGTTSYTEQFNTVTGSPAISSTCQAQMPAPQWVQAKVNGNDGNVWGNNVTGYTIDSNLAKAIVHAGLANPGEYAYVYASPLGSLPAYMGTIANGVTSFDTQQPICGMKLTVGQKTAIAPPTLKVVRYPNPHIAGQEYEVDWSTTNATSLTRSCTAAGTGLSGTVTLPLNDGERRTADAAWVGNPSTCTWTATGPGGSVTWAETVTTLAQSSPAQADAIPAAPTITVNRSSTMLAVGQSSKVTWTSTNANTVSLSCTAASGGYTDSGVGLPTSGERTITAQSAWVGNPTTCTWMASGAGGTRSYTETLTTYAPTDGAQFVSQSVPATMEVGKAYPVSITLKNTGNTTWTAADKYRLGTQNPQDNLAWMLGNRVELDAPVAPGAQKTLNFTVTAPATAGSYNFQWQMVKEFVAWFGDKSTNVPVAVTAPTVTAACQSMTQASGTYTGTNTGGGVWGSNDSGYTADSNIAVAIVHAGLAAPGQSVFVKVIPLDKLPGFTGTTANGITTMNYTNPACAMRLMLGTPLPTITVTRDPTPLYAGQNFTTTWATTNATTVSYTCTAATGGMSGSASGLPANGSSSGTAQSAWIGNPSTCTWTATGPGGTKTYSETLTTVVPVNNAQAVAQSSIPSTMVAGRAYTVSLTLKNTGTTTWTPGAGYKLGTRNPQDNLNWMTSNRVLLDAPVPAGAQKTFTFTINAPTKPGTYNFQWQMLREYVEWFGDATANVAVTVGAAASSDLATTLTGTSTNVRLTSGTTAAVTFTGQGTSASAKLAKVELLQNTTYGYTPVPGAFAASTSGVASLSLPAAAQTQNLAAGSYQFKLRSTDTQGNIADSSVVIVNIADGSLLGTIDGVRVNAQTAPPLLTGWVCQDGSAEALSYQLFINAPTQAMGGTPIATGSANLTSDPANATVQATCHTPGTGHHFSIDLTAAASTVTGGLGAGTPLYVVARTAGGNSVVLPCADNNCTMPGSLRIALSTPKNGDVYQAPASVFMRAVISGDNAPYDEVALSFNGQWIAAQPDTAANTYIATKSNVGGLPAPVPVMAKVRKGNVTVYSVINLVTVNGPADNTLAMQGPAEGTSLPVSFPITLSAKLSGTAASIASVKFLANGTVVGTATTSSNGVWTASWTSATVNAYSIMAVAYDGSGNALLQSTAVNIVVNNGTSSPDTPIGVNITPPHLGNADAGSLPGNLSVGNGGTATYSIPIPVPPGTGGMAPSLSLNYSSGSGNGMLGVGWSLGGLSNIHRCSKTIAQDGMPGRIGFNTADRLCLDGMRLLRVDGANPGTAVSAIDAAYWASGAQYRTEQETFARITRLSNGGFKVESKDGRILYYGIDSNSAIAAQGPNAGQTLIWALARVEDRSGNYMTIEYNTDSATGEFLPTQIRYGGNTNANQSPDLAVRFTYESRDDGASLHDTHMLYIGGSRNDLRSRLTHVQTYINTAANGIGDTLVRDHQIHYTVSGTSGRSLVDWMQVSAVNPNTNQLEYLPKTVFEWGQGGTPAFKALPIQPFALPTVDTLPPIRFQGDFDGSGRTSFAAAGVYPYNDQYVDSKYSQVLSGHFRIRLPGGQVVDSALSGSLGTIMRRDPNSSLPAILVGDLDGDGLDDLVLVDQFTKQWAYCLNTYAASGSINFSCSSGGTGIPSLIDLRNERKTHFLLPFDINGNGSDCQLVNGTMQCTQLHISAPSEMLSADTYQLAGIDLSQQGLSDFYLRWEKLITPNNVSQGVWPVGATVRGLAVCFNPQNGITCQSLVAGQYPVINVQNVGDLNGDGLTDFAYSLAVPGVNDGIHVCLSKENGVDCRVDNLGADPKVAQAFNQTNKMGNFTGDGISRALFAVVPRDSNNQPDYTNAKSKLCQYTDAGFSCLDLPYSPAADAGTFVGFFDDSGVPGFLMNPDAANQNASTPPNYQAMTLVRPAEQDKIVAVTNGMGYREEVSYAYGDDTTVYAKVAVIDGAARRPSYPSFAMPPGVLAKTLRRSNGQGGWLSTDYHFEGSAFDVQRRASLGFAKVQTTDAQSGVRSVSNLSQVYPYVGLPIHSQTTSGAGIALNDTQSTFDQQTFTQPSGAQTIFAFVKQTSAASKDLDGSDLGASVTVSEYGDGWGNLTRQTATTTGNGQSFTQDTVTAYLNDSTGWIIGRPTQVTVTKSDQNATLSRTTAFGYDAAGLLKTETVEPGNTTYQVVTTHDRSGNSFGLVNKVTRSWLDPYTGTTINRTVSDTTFDSKGRFAVQVKNALGQAETHGFDPRTGVMTSLTGPNLLTTAWTVDGFGRTSVEKRADGNETRKYTKQCNSDCPAGAVLASVTQDFHGNSAITVPSVAYSDSAGHVMQEKTWGFNGKVIVSDRRYDSFGRLKETDRPHFDSDAAYLAGTQTYDELNRVKDVTAFDEANQPQTAHIGYQGLATVKTDAKGNATTETRDVLGRTAQVKDAKGYFTTFTYDPFGNLKMTTDPNGNVVKVDYDKLGRKTDLRDPDLGWVHYDVDPIGQVWKQTSPVQRAKGQFTRFEFDALGRMTGRYEPDLESHWVFDTAANGNGIGKLAEAYTGTPGVKDYRRLHTYDTLGRPSQTTQVLFDGSYLGKAEYDAWGRVIRQTSQRNTDTPKIYDLRYDAQGQLARVERGSLVLWKLTGQDAARRATQALLGNGLTRKNGYNAYSGRLEGALLVNAANAPLFQEDYQYDVLGNVKQRTHYWGSVGFGETFDYDELNRLKSSQVAGQAAQLYTYDAVGNLKSKTGTGTGDYVYPPQGATSVQPHAVQSIPGVGSFGYDVNGNLTSGGGRTVTWKSFDMPDTITKGNASAAFTYGPEHQRTKQVRGDGSVTVYAGAQEVERNSAGTQVTVKTYWPGGIGVEIDRPNAATELNWTHADHLGSVAAITDAAGNIKEKLEYDAWGKRRTPDGSATPDTLDGVVDNKGYTGHEMLDQLDLVHMNGRVYDPFTARFMSGDPFIQAPGNGQSYNRYSYVWNNPLNATDPSGYLSLFGHKILPGLFNDDNARLAASIAAAYVLGPGGMLTTGITGSAFASSVIAGAVAGGIASDNSRGILQGAAMGALFYGAGSFAGEMGWASGSIGRAAAHAVAGCLGAMVADGSCGRGALSAGFAEGIGGNIKGGSFAANVALRAVIGGTASVLGGGSFKNGAITGAFGYLFNECAHTRGCGLGGRDSYSGSVPLTDASGRVVIGGDGMPVLLPEGVDMNTFAQAGRNAAVAMEGSPAGLGVLGGGLYDFRRGGSWDLQRLDGYFHPRYIDAATVAIGVYSASAGMAMSDILSVQNFVARSGVYAPGTVMDPTYKYLPVRNVTNTKIGYGLVNSGRF